VNAEVSKLRKMKFERATAFTRSNESAPKDEQPFERKRRHDVLWVQVGEAALTEATRSYTMFRAEKQQLEREIELEKRKVSKPKDAALVSLMQQDYKGRIDQAGSAVERAAVIRSVVDEAGASGDPDLIRAARLAVTPQIDAVSRQLGGGAQAVQLRNTGRKIRDLADDQPALASLESRLADLNHAGQMLAGEVGALRVEVTERGKTASWDDELEKARPEPLSPLPPPGVSVADAPPGQTLHELIERNRLASEVAELRKKVADAEAAGSAAEAPGSAEEAVGE
jgi:hypothetical protein